MNKALFAIIASAVVVLCACTTYSATAKTGSAPILYEVAFTELNKGIFEDENHLAQLHAEKQYALWIAYNDADMDAHLCHVTFECAAMPLPAHDYAITQRRSFPTAVGFGIDFPATLIGQRIVVFAQVIDKDGNASQSKRIAVTIVP